MTDKTPQASEQNLAAADGKAEARPRRAAKRTAGARAAATLARPARKPGGAL
ncbi:hypothetical protein [Achromobacter ruhlandii]|uniref:hypothetical protein n=1 Tax=Achromobacter ruhlandii TaxID=72557 RepID=UPI0022B89313|nr:hypothetical protein [Achromobacter ruhlandii]MCZ8399408.1 hypothetical protein [Achromobacter ruhlandii]